MVRAIVIIFHSQLFDFYLCILHARNGAAVRFRGARNISIPFVRGLNEPLTRSGKREKKNTFHVHVRTIEERIPFEDLLTKTDRSIDPL
jgi:hypothetical protein